MNIIESLQWRYATKSFDKSKKISPQEWNKIEDALVLSASSFGLQPWKFVIISDTEKRKKMTPLSWNQTQVENCSHYVVFCAKNNIDADYVEKFISSIATTRNIDKSYLDQYKELMTGFVNNLSKEELLNWAKKQCYVALGNVLTVAATMQIDACPMEGIDPAGYDEIIKVSEYNTVFTCAFGYRSDSDQYAKLSKVRFSKEEIIHHI
jgi:nitroreductase